MGQKNSTVSSLRSRVFANIADILIGYMAAGILFLVIRIFIEKKFDSFNNGYFDLYASIMTALILYLAIFLFNFLSWNATPGKRFVGIKIVDCNNNSLSFIKAIGISAINTLQFILLCPIFYLNSIYIVFLFGIGIALFIMPYILAFSRNKQRILPDLLSGVTVVYKEYTQQDEVILKLDSLGIEEVEGVLTWQPQKIFGEKKSYKILITPVEKNRIIFYTSKFVNMPILVGIFILFQGVFSKNYEEHAIRITIGAFLVIVSLIYYCVGLSYLKKIENKNHRIEVK